MYQFVFIEHKQLRITIIFSHSPDREKVQHTTEKSTKCNFQLQDITATRKIF